MTEFEPLEQLKAYPHHEMIVSPDATDALRLIEIAENVGSDACCLAVFSSDEIGRDRAYSFAELCEQPGRPGTPSPPIPGFPVKGVLLTRGSPGQNIPAHMFNSRVVMQLSYSGERPDINPESLTYDD